MNNHLPKISFGVIVLNGEPYTRYCLRALYPFAHQIIVAEGACPAAAANATPDGHSTDGTLDILRQFKAHDDPDNKLVIVTAEDLGHPNGFWPGEKNEQSQAYAARATGDYLWQVDIDEFYLPQHMQAVCDMLTADPTITAMSFKMLTFFGSPHHIVDGPFLKGGAEIYHRLFKWGRAYRYTTHRPPTVVDERNTDLRSKHWIDGYTLAQRGIVMLHYSLLLPQQVFEKAVYYDKAQQFRYKPLEWFEQSYQKLRWPFRYHNVYLWRSWLERYPGQVPDQIQQMMADLHAGRHHTTARHTNDIERLLSSRSYRAQRWFWRHYYDLKAAAAWRRRAYGSRIATLLRPRPCIEKVSSCAS
jgi:glycosyltransferase involved in cell wall biosynthesis